MATKPLRRFGVLAASVALVASAFGAPASAGTSATADLNLDNITIDVVTANGTGCRPNTVGGWWNGNSGFTLRYYDYDVEAGPGAREASRKNCQLSLNMHIPSGKSYAIVRSTYRGYADIARGATGYFQANYYVQGQSQGKSATSTYRGPYNQRFQADDAIGFENAVWSPCGNDRYMNINTSLRLDAGNSNKVSRMYIGEQNVDITTYYEVKWRNC